MTNNTQSPTQPSSLPSRVPPPTGNIVYDSLEASLSVGIHPQALTQVNVLPQSAKHVTELPCARNALLAGIVSGAGMGVIRGVSAGKWSCKSCVGTFDPLFRANDGRELGGGDICSDIVGFMVRSTYQIS
jgi:hypothetical protein